MQLSTDDENDDRDENTNAEQQPGWRPGARGPERSVGNGARVDHHVHSRPQLPILVAHARSLLSAARARESVVLTLASLMPSVEAISAYSASK